MAWNEPWADSFLDPVTYFSSDLLVRLRRMYQRFFSFGFYFFLTLFTLGIFIYLFLIIFFWSSFGFDSAASERDLLNRTGSFPLLSPIFSLFGIIWEYGRSEEYTVIDLGSINWDGMG